MSRFISSCAIAVCLAAAAHADVYKSVDAKGEVHYSDVWSPGAVSIKAGSTSPQSAPPAPTATAPAPTRPPANSPDPGKTAAQKAVAADVAATRATQCEALKDQYAKQIRALRITTAESTPENPQYLSEAEADAERVRTRQAMEAACAETTGAGN